MTSPKRIETSGTVLIVYYADGARHLDMTQYLKQWATPDAKRLLKNIDGDLSKAFLEDGYAISWPGYNLSIDPETFYEDALPGKPTAISAKLVKALRKLTQP